MRVAADSDDDNDLRLIFAPGSSLGGARAKASVLDLQGQLSIAKFPQTDDAYPVMQWEAVALDLARRAGIEVPTCRNLWANRPRHQSHGISIRVSRRPVMISHRANWSA